MSQHIQPKKSFLFIVIQLLFVCSLQIHASEIDSVAKSILTSAGVQGGLVVHAGCRDGQLTVALHQNDGFLVHGLEQDENQVKAARNYIQSLGKYGTISIDRWDGLTLPYIDNSVNLLVMEEQGKVTADEIRRVLCPKGVAFIKKNGQWSKTIKPRPGGMDEWTHYLYEPNNNAVSQDNEVQPLRHLQWIGGPKFSRHHDHMSSSSAIVSANNRNFYIFDEGSPVSIQLPSKWKLIARDAFNGKILWKRDMGPWQTQLTRLKSGPASLPRRIVAIGDTVYVTLAIDAPVTALAAATGKTIKTYKGTKNTEEILYSNGILFLVIKDSPFDLSPKRRGYDSWLKKDTRRILAVEAASGTILWEKSWRWVAPVTLAVDDNQVCFFDGETIVSLHRESGKKQWQSETLGKNGPIPSYFAPTLVLYKDTVLFSGADTGDKEYHTDNGKTMYALDAESGEKLWQGEHPPAGYRSAEDILVIDELVWTSAVFMGNDSGVITGRDPRTGEVKVEFPPDVDTYWFHHRCYRAKATKNYLLMSRTGIEFVDYKKEHWQCHHWVRGACLYGIMPANGMIYTSPHPCACYLEAKLFGFNALAPTSPSRQLPANIPDKGRWQKGPAYGNVNVEEMANKEDWPTYRNDTERSGFTKNAVKADLHPAWKTKIGGKLSSVIVAGEKLFVAAVDTHTIHALDAASGKPAWTFTAGGRVDSPPTFWQGRLYFGSKDGYVYCLRASNGELVWRFRAAPMDRRLVAFEQLESAWPVHGSVLILDAEQSASGKTEVWCAAGRSMFLDGGLRLLRLDAETGTKLDEKIFDDTMPEEDENLQALVKGLNMPVALNDILSSDGKHVFMRSQQFDKKGERAELANPTRGARQQQGEGAHLFAPTGFLDDAYWHRSYWVYGKRWKSGAGGYYLAGRFAPSGRMLVFDEDQVYGFSREPEYFKWTTPLERKLYSSSKSPKILRIRPKDTRPGFKGNRPVDEKIESQWAESIPLYVQAMVLADDTLFVAGPRDLIDENKTLNQFEKEDVQERLTKQDAVIAGEEGSLLCSYSAKDGRELSQLEIDAPPVWDGMAAARGHIFLALKNGSVACLKPTTKLLYWEKDSHE